MASARAAALHALAELEGAVTERLRDALDRERLTGRDQALAYELAHGVVRRERLLDHVLSAFAHRGLPKDRVQRSALRLGAYQLLFATGIPAHAAVHETVELVRNNKGFLNAMLRAVGNCVLPRAADPTRPVAELALGPTRCLLLPKPLPEAELERLSVVHSLPFFLLQRWRQHFGDAGVRQIAVAASEPAPVFLRPIGGDAAALAAALLAEGVSCAPASGPYLRWTGGAAPFGTNTFRTGHFVVQDPTAGAAADAVPCHPGATVVDLCAAPGTKTVLLAERVRPGGTVHAFDIAPERRGRIAENAARLGFTATVQVAAATADLPSADAVLADVPCSNSGVLGRRVEVRRRITGTTFARMAAEQRTLLRFAIGRCRTGGAVVYSTCSIDREENENVVRAVLGASDLPPCTLEAEQCTLPQAGVCDGGYWARLRVGLPG
jgi:16S rRNA (cytosine967-C5)-methyltransferase